MSSDEKEDDSMKSISTGEELEVLNSDLDVSEFEGFNSDDA